MSEKERPWYSAQRKWEEAGRPGPDPQLPLFPLHLHRAPEVEKASKLDRPRRYRRR